MDLYYPPGGAGNIHIVRNHQNGNTLFIEAVQQFNNFLAFGAVQITSRLVSNDDFGVVGQSPGYCHPLALSAGQLVGFLLQPVTQSNGPQALGGSGFSGALSHPGKNQRQHDIFQGRGVALQIKGLEYKANMGIAVIAKLAVAGAAQILAIYHDRAACGFIQTANNIGQR